MSAQQLSNQTAVEVAQITEALDQILGAHTRINRRRDAHPVSASDLASDFLKRLDASVTALEREVMDLLRDPVRESLNRSIRVMGERLHEIGGVRLMQDALHEISERDPPNRARRESVLDHRWNGIGHWLS